MSPWNAAEELEEDGRDRPRRAVSPRPHEPPRAHVRLDGCLIGTAGSDNAVRWRAGERLEDLFEQRCDESAGAIATDGPDGRLSYAELEVRANQLARYLALRQGVVAGDRLALLFDRPVDNYVAMLAALKLHTAYVPLDRAFPAERIAFILGDAEVRMLLSVSHLAGAFDAAELSAPILCLDRVDSEIAGERDVRLEPGERGEPENDLCYVVYTSGTTGRPKGVAVSHASICNFVRVAAEVYGVHSGDRVYQGLTLAFDFSVEEIWVAWMVGATLVPRPAGPPLLGRELSEFLREWRVSALCCVPTLLATLEGELPDLRLLLVSGEPCPPELVARWSRPRRRFLNVYGPTETTVSATWTALHPSRPVTIGVPLPTYCAVVLDPEADRVLATGELGELGIAGVGLADGYIGRPDLTARAFVPDFIGLPENPSRRIYRTGDLARITAAGEIEHHGRIDDQVKIRGYRIELSEIEAVLCEVPGVAAATVTTCEVAGNIELVAYYCERGPVDRALALARLREALPAFMVPSYLERLEQLPRMVSGKIDREALPRPSAERLGDIPRRYVPPANELELTIASELAEVLGLERASTGADFFDELGMSSLAAAGLCSRLRDHAELPPVSLRDLYAHPTVAELAQACRAPEPELGPWREPELPDPVGTPHYFLCGALQLLVFFAYAAAGALAFDRGAAWLLASSGVLEACARALALGGALVLAMGIAPIVVKWTLIGRFRPARIRVWSLAYVRFWIVKTLLVANPLPHLLLDTPLYALYLRALGADVSPRALIFSQHLPVCTDLLTIGRDAVILKDSYFNGYRARDGVIEIGPVSVGAGAFVGERAVLDIHTAIERDGQLGHASSLQSGQTVPAQSCWHGSPARPAGAEVNYRTVPSVALGNARRARYAAGRMLALLAVLGPAEAAIGALLLTHPRLVDRLPLADVAWIPALLLAGALVGSLIVVTTVPRAAARALRPGRIYPVYGFRFSLERLIFRASNNPLLMHLFGDSSAVVHYLREIGYNLGAVEQTGTNFGVDVHHELPTLTTVGAGTIVSDGLSVMNAEFSASAFRVLPVAVGERNYLGNNISFPAAARTGADCLLASRVLVPTSGPVRENVGLLGSPSFEIPRTRSRAQRFEELANGPERRRRLRAKARHNLLTAALHLGMLYLIIAGLVWIAWAPMRNWGAGEWGATLASIVTGLLFVILVGIVGERVVMLVHPVRPKLCSIYERDFWRHERYWKAAALTYLHALDGTPFKVLAWRALGARVGRRVFDDGLSIVERPLVVIGDECTFNMGSELQSHTLEDGVFESDFITLGRRCTLGTGALVNHAVELGDGAIIEADSFVIKGSRVRPGARWRGNPAAEVCATTPLPTNERRRPRAVVPVGAPTTQWEVR
jgi:non-ribosomal peptide synthetase-like protein